MAGRLTLPSALLAASLLGSACGQPPEAGALTAVIRAAETAELNLSDAPSSYYRDGDPATVMHPMLDRAAATLARYYTGSLLAQKVATETSAIRQQLGARAGGTIGYVGAIELAGVHVTGEQANVRARITLRFKSTQFWYQDPRAAPVRAWATNVVDENFRLVMQGGAWKIDAESWQFAPGGGP